MRVTHPFTQFKDTIYCKIAIGGDGGVGKTTLCQRLTGRSEIKDDLSMTTGIDFHSLKIIDGQIIDVQLWDLGGQDRFRKFQDDFFKAAVIIILVFSVGRPLSFYNLYKWLDLIRQEKPFEVYLLANKVDLDDRLISREEAIEFAIENNMKYFEISAKEGNGFFEFENQIINSLNKSYNKE